MGYRSPTLLSSEHVVADFRCASVEQTSWLVNYAMQSHKAGTAKVHVVTEAGGVVVVAYYALAMAQLEYGALPDRWKKGAARYPQPVLLLARLGVDERHEGEGLGAGLLQQVILRVAAASMDVGCRGLLIHAETDEAVEFYRHNLPSIAESPTDKRHLVLLLKDIKKTLASMG